MYNPSEIVTRYYGEAPYWSENPYLSQPYPQGSYKARKLIGATVRASDGEVARIRDLEVSSLDGYVHAVFPYNVEGTVRMVRVPLSFMTKSRNNTFVLNIVD